MSNESPTALWSVLLLAGGVVLLLLGGKWLVDGSVSIARRLGVSTLVIGLTLVAFGTSAPELALNIVAAASGETGLAFGNVVGSNIANIGLVIGLSALAGPLLITSRIIRLDLPWLMVVTVLFILLSWLPPGVNGQPGYTHFEGILLILGAVALGLHWYWVGRQKRDDALTTEATSSEAIGPTDSALSRSLPLSIGAALLGIILLILGGKGAEVGAVNIAMLLGVDEVLIGLTIVAIATTLPEIATCVIAARSGQPDLAVGTVVGSNLFNIVLVMGITSVVHPVEVPPGGWWALGSMTFFTLLLWPLACSQRRVGRAEGSMLLLLYAISIGVSIWLETTNTHEKQPTDPAPTSALDGQIVIPDPDVHAL